MSPRRTRRGTIRESVSEISVNNSLKSTSKRLRSTRHTNKSQTMKSSEEDSDSPMELNNPLDNATSYSNNNSINIRTRKRNNQDMSMNQNSSMSITIEKSNNKVHTKKNNLRTPKSKKQTKSDIINVDSLISEDESFNVKSQQDEKKASYNTNSVISEDEEISEALSKKKIKSDNKKSSSNKKECKTPEKSLSRNLTTTKLSEEEITPKSSPLNVSFTPHRSTKTPKKSPVNLGSPKTHSHNSLKLLNVPRKLSIADSPPSSEKSSNSLQHGTPDIVNESIKSRSKRHKSSKSMSKSSKRKSFSPLKIRPRFSKSPKIVLRTPKSKSAKSSKKSPTRKTLSSTMLKKTSKVDSSSKSILIDADLSLKSETTPDVNSSVKSKESLQTDSSLIVAESPDLLLQSEKMVKAISFDKSENTNSLLNPEKTHEGTSPIKSKKSPKTILSQKSKMLPEKASSVKSKTSPKLVSPINFKKSSKIITPLNSKKMPKIFLTSKSRKSPLKSPKKSLSTSKKSPKISPSKVKVTSVKLPTRDSIANNDLSKNSSMSPRVIVSKLSTAQLRNSSLCAKETRPCIKLVPVDHSVQSSLTLQRQQFQLNKSPKSPKSSAKKDSISSTSKKFDTQNLSFKSNTPYDVLEKKLVNLRPTNTSTPREKIKHTLNLAPNKKRVSPKSKVIKRLNNQSKIKTDHPLLEDESEPSMNDSSLIHMSDVFDSDNSQKNNTFEINKNDSSTLAKRKSVKDLNTSQKSNKSTSVKDKSAKNGTYEVENPKTPGLQKKSSKRTLDETEISVNEERESKRTCRVQFLSPDLRSHIRSSGINRVGTPGHAIQQKRVSVPSISKVKTPVNKVENSRRVNPISASQIKTPINKRETTLLSDTSLRSRKSNHEVQVASVNRLSKPRTTTNSDKKLRTRTPVHKKIPNFAEIHQKNFAKMESLIDLKKRVEKRHITLNAATSSTKKNPLKRVSVNNKPVPPDSTNGAYNRFGFKLRKHDAVNIISKKQIGSSKESREKKREDARTALKGVRMNRRFELQMKSRTKNS